MHEWFSRRQASLSEFLAKLLRREEGDKTEPESGEVATFVFDADNRLKEVIEKNAVQRS